MELCGISEKFLAWRHASDNGCVRANANELLENAFVWMPIAISEYSACVWIVKFNI